MFTYVVSTVSVYQYIYRRSGEAHMSRLYTGLALEGLICSRD